MSSAPLPNPVATATPASPPQSTTAPRRPLCQHETLWLALALAGAITVVAWLVLALAAPLLVAIFNASGETAALIVFFCHWLAPLFVFFGMMFVCNAACNTLDRPHYVTALSWGRATFGTVPFVMLGSYWGAEGVLLGHMAGGIAFGLAAVLVVQRLIARLDVP